MLFLVKRTAGPALAAALILTLVGFGLRGALWLDGAAPPFGGASARAAVGLGAIIASDALVHATLALALTGRYLRRFGALVDLFDGQTVAAAAAAGVLAAAEEVAFRGGLLDALRGPLGDPAALAVAALAFGLAHHVPRPGFAPFTAWSVWEGALLGGVYLLTDSLPLTALVHAAHDLGGFAAFAGIRRARRREPPTGRLGRMLAERLLPPREPGAADLMSESARTGGGVVDPFASAAAPDPSMSGSRRAPRILLFGCGGFLLAGLIGLTVLAYFTFRAVVTDPLEVREQALDILPIAIPRECEGQLAIRVMDLRFVFLGDLDGPKPLQVVLASSPPTKSREDNRKQLHDRLSRKGRYKLKDKEWWRETFTYSDSEVEALVYPSEYDGRELVQYEVFVEHGGRQVILGVAGLPKELTHDRVQAILDPG